MPPRPGSIETIITPGLARPRGLEARKNPQFQKAADQITAILLERGVLRRGA